MPEPPTATQRFLLFATGLTTALALAFLRALEGQFSRLHVPLDGSYGYNALHGAHPGDAVRAWVAGAKSLHSFGVIDPRAMTTVHFGFDVAFALLLAAFLVLMIWRLDVTRRLWVVVGLGLAADIVEGFLELALVDPVQPATDRYTSWFPVLAFVKYAAPLIVIAVLVGVALQGGRFGRAWQYYRRASATSRVIFVAALGFTALLQFGDIGAQVEDLLRREFNVPGLLRAGVALVAYVFVLALVRRIVAGSGSRPSSRWIVAIGVGLSAVGALILWVGHGGSAFAVGGVLVLVVGLTSWAVDCLADGIEEDDDPDTVARWLYVWAATLPIMGIALVAARLLAGEVATQGAWVRLVVIIAVLLAAAVGVFVWFTASAGAAEIAAEDFPLYGTLYLSLVVGGVAVLAIGQFFSDDWSFGIGRALGPFAVLLLGLAALAAAAGLLRRFSTDLGRPSVFVWFSTKRTPVVTLLVVWALVVNLAAVRFEDPSSSPHVVRDLKLTMRASKPCADPRLSFGSDEVALALCNWLVTNAAPVGNRDGLNDDGPVPLVLASASGGGVRAAAWTARVLDCLFLAAPTRTSDPCGTARVPARAGHHDNWSLLFAAGGASGGSVGIASALTHQVTDATSRDDWIGELAGNDHVSRVLARMLLSELPLAPFGIESRVDRAEVLIDSWIKPFGTIDKCDETNGREVSDVGFLELRRDCAENVPLLMLNGTVVATGKRFDISPLNLSTEPGLRDVLCADRDIPLFDAAFLSARFPFVTPSGHFLRGSKKKCWRNTTSAVEVVDGGYAENSGAAQIGVLWPKLRPLIEKYNATKPAGFAPVRPVFLQIENGEKRSDAFGPLDIDAQIGAHVGEPFKPLAAGFAARVGSGVDAEAMQHLLAEFTRTGVPIVTAGLYPHPGRRLPLGWTLTGAVLDDIDNVFQLCPNRQEAKAFRAYVNGEEPTSRLARTRDGELAGGCE